MQNINSGQDISGGLGFGNTFRQKAHLKSNHFKSYRNLGQNRGDKQFNV